MATQQAMKLWYTIPAPTLNDGDFARQNDRPFAGWEKWSLPLGNSYFGVSVFGRIETERLQITENSVCNPGLRGSHWKDGSGGTRTFGDIYIDTFHKDVENYGSFTASVVFSFLALTTQCCFSKEKSPKGRIRQISLR